MMPRYLTRAVVGLACARLASAQLFSDCNPTKEDNCPPNPAVGDDVITIDFRDGASEHFSVLPGTPVTYDPTKGAVLSIGTDNDSPTMVSNEYIFYGRVDVVFQAAPGKGIVTAITLQSEDLDEIDLEWVGADQMQVQTNYFAAGFTGNYDRGGYHQVGGNAMMEEHKYSLVWMPDKLDWLIDDNVIRTLVRDDSVDDAYRYPQTPSRIRLGTWVAGKEGQSNGTIQWAGGMAEWDEAPFDAYLKTVTFSDYANGIENAKEYVWTDRSGLDSSIEVVTHDEDDSTTTVDAVEATTTAAEATSAAAETTAADTTAYDEAETTAADTAAYNEAETTAVEETTTGDAATETTEAAADVDLEITASPTGKEPAATSVASETDGETGGYKPRPGSGLEDDDEDCEDEDEDTEYLEDEEEAVAATTTYASSTVIVVPTACVTTAEDGVVTTVTAQVTVTVPCDKDGTPITEVVNAPSTLATVTKPSRVYPTSAAEEAEGADGDITKTTETQTGWRPVRTGGVGYIPAIEGDDDDVPVPTSSASAPQYGSGSGSGSVSDSSPGSGSSSGAIIPSSNGTSTISPTPSTVLVGAASSFQASSFAALVAIIGAILII